MSFSWSPLVHELFVKLVMDYDSRSLAKLVYEIFPEKSLLDRDAEGREARLEEFEPCTFLARFNRNERKETRLGYYAKAKEALKLKSPVPRDLNGIPTFNNQSFWLFPYKYRRKGHEFRILWDLARELAQDQLTEERFNNALTVPGTGSTYLTVICFLVHPKRYLPLDANTRSLIEGAAPGSSLVFDLTKGTNAFQSYKSILETTKKIFPDQTPMDLSHKAWEISQAHDGAPESSPVKRSRYRDLVANFGKDNVTSFLNILKQVVRASDLTPQDDRVTFSCRRNVLSFTVGQRYALSMSKDEDGLSLGFGTLKKTPNTSGPYEGAPRAYYNVSEDFSEAELALPEIIEFSQEHLDGCKRSGFFTRYDEPEFRNAVFEGAPTLKTSGNITLWMAGSDWSGEDQTEDFIRNQHWQNGFKPSSEDPSIATVKRARPGDWIAIKSASTKGPGRSITFTKIKAIGRVTENFGDGASLNVDWIYTGPKFDLDGISYRKTFEAAKAEHADLVLKRIQGTGATVHSNINDRWSEPKNVIYWGPPGTGKTYTLLKEQETFRNAGASSVDQIVRSIQDFSWWDTIAAALIELNRPVTVPELFNHEFVQIKARQSATQTPKNSIWSNLQSHTIKESKTVRFERRTDPLVVDKDSESRWFLTGDWREQLSDIVTRVADLRPNQPKSATRRYETITFHQSYSYEEFVEGIRPEPNSDGSSIQYEVRPGVFKRLCQRAMENPNEQYALFIDEINRGNISKIFGELITLIEPDKRLGMPHEVTVTLPYSGTTFGVPRNLHIIGTMNSVDRSVALVDMALRRRFKFISVRPNPSLVSGDVGGVDLRRVFILINQKISVLLGSEFQLGHSYFMGRKANSIDSFQETWFGNILPLLQEYLFDDWEKLKALVGPFVQETPVPALESLAIARSTYGAFVSPEISVGDFARMLKALE